jgi:hypothetical protein
MRTQHVYDPLISKRQQFLLATQVVRMILRVDDVIGKCIILDQWGSTLTLQMLLHSQMKNRQMMMHAVPLDIAHRLCASTLIRSRINRQKVGRSCVLTSASSSTMSLTNPAARSLVQSTVFRSSRCQCHIKVPRSWTRQQSSSAGPHKKPTPPKRDRRYYLLALPLAFLPFSFFGSSKRPLDPYTYSDHPVASTSKLTPQHARIRIPLSPSDAALFAGASGDGVVTVEHVMIKNPDLQIERPYTPVNDIAKDGELDLVVKRVQGGEVGR